VEGLSGIGGEERPGIVHRLDKDTSGVLVVAKRDEAHQALSAQFAAHSVERIYRALVVGSPPGEGRFEAPIGRDPRDRKRFAVAPEGKGKHAITHWRVVESLGPFALLDVELETGRTHQIRVHMAAQGWPLMGDPVYGPRRAPRVLRDAGISWPSRQMLHAGVLGFDHPASGERMRFTSPLPTDMEELLQRLRGVYGS
jgi:23S rRNA pseudouridine1911/1915/1917 synthase